MDKLRPSIGLALDGWLLRLAEQEFRIGPRERLAVQTLLLQLAAEGELPAEPAAVLALVEPLLCSSRDQQLRYRLQLRDYLQELQAAQGRSVLQRLRRSVGSPPGGQQAMAAPPGRPQRWWAAGLIALLWAVLVLGQWMWLQPRQVAAPPPPVPSVPGLGTPQPQPVPLWYVLPRPLPEPPAALPQPGSDGLRLALYTLAGAGAALLLAAAWRARRRDMVLRGTRSDEAVRHHLMVDPAPVSVAPHPALARSVGRALRQRVAGELLTLELGATLRATINAHGAFSPRWQPLQRMPEYLVLVEQRHPADHLTALALAWTGALERAGVPLQLHFYDGSPAAGCWPDSAAARRDPLARKRLAWAELCTRASGRRLLLFGDTAAAINPATGLPQPWLRALQPLAERAWFTPVPLAQWGAAEDTADHAGLLVLPLQEAALHTLAQAFSGGRLSLAADPDTPGALPPALQDSGLGWASSDATPPAAACQELLQDLRRWLGAMRFQWLAACAIFPQLTPPLTLALGRQVLKGQVGDTERSLALGMAAFTALPWFREGRMPRWLQQALQAQLSPVQRDGLQAVVQQRLNTALGRGTGAPLADVATRISSWLRRRSGLAQDLMLADFLQRKDLLTRQLQRLPEGLRQRLFRHGRPGLGLQPWLLAPPAALVLAGVLAATPLWERAMGGPLQSPLPLLASWPLGAGTGGGDVRISFVAESRLRVEDGSGRRTDWTLPDRQQLSSSTTPLPPLAGLSAEQQATAWQPGSHVHPDGSAALEIDAASGAPLLRQFRGNAEVRAPLSVDAGQLALRLAFTPGGRRVVGVMNDGRIRVWGLPRLEYVSLACSNAPQVDTLPLAVAIIAEQHRAALAGFTQQTTVDFVGMLPVLWRALHPNTPEPAAGQVRYGIELDDPGDRLWLQREGVTLVRDPSLLESAVSNSCQEAGGAAPPREDAVAGLDPARQSVLSARVARMFGPLRDDGLAATQALVADNDALSDAVRLALPRAARALQAPGRPVSDQQASGVSNTLVLLQAATPATLRREQAAIGALLAPAATLGGQIDKQVQAVRQALQKAQGLQAELRINPANEAQLPVAQALASSLRKPGLTVTVAAKPVANPPSRAQLRLLGASDRALARELAQGIGGALSTPVALISVDKSQASNDRYELWLDPAPCSTRQIALCGANARPSAAEVGASSATREAPRKKTIVNVFTDDPMIVFTLEPELMKAGYTVVTQSAPVQELSISWYGAPAAFVEEVLVITERVTGRSSGSFKRLLEDKPILQNQIFINLPLQPATGRANTQPLTAVSGTLPEATVGQSYRWQLVLGGTQPYRLYTEGKDETRLPQGLSVALDAKLVGVPTIPGQYRFSLFFLDGSGASISQTFDLLVKPAATTRAAEQNKK